MNARSLTTHSLKWLLLERKCVMACTERGFWGKPDALGLTKGRKLIEVETKISLADFNANQDKYYIRMMDGHFNDTDLSNQYSTMPTEFFYIVPEFLAEKILKRIPPYAGLLTVVNEEICILKNCVKLKRPKLDIQNCVKMARFQALDVMNCHIKFVSLLKKRN